MIGSILLKIIKGIVMKSGQASLKAAQETAKKAGNEMGKNHPAFQKFARLQRLLKIGSYLAFIIDFGGVLLIGFAMVIMLAIMSGNNTECETSTPEINLPDSNDNGKYSLEDISTFAKQGLTSSWGVSNTDAELLFLKTKQAQQSIRKISDQDKSNLTSDQLNANQTQLDALNGEVESQTTAIQTIKTSLETEEVNLEKAQRILKAIKTSSNDQEIADALG